MIKKCLFCFMFLWVGIISVFGETKVEVKKSLSIMQTEPQEKKIESRKERILYSIDNESIVKHKFINMYDTVSSYQIEKNDKSFKLNYINNDSFETLYTLTFLSKNIVVINNTDTYLLKEDSYLKLYNDLVSGDSIISMLKFLIFCPYFFLDENMQNLPFYFYDLDYEILEGCFYVQSPDSDFICEHLIQYQYNDNKCIGINSTCINENFIGLSYQIIFEYKQSKISNVSIDVSYFEKRSDNYSIFFDYKNKAISVFGESTHSYFTDIINYLFITENK